MAKAAGFNSVVAVLRDDLLGADAFAAVVGKLPPATAEAIKSPPLPVSWIPCERYGDLVSSALVHGFGGNEERLVEMGRRAFLHDLKTVYRVFIKLMSPGFVIDRATKLWLTYNRDNGLLTARQLGDRCAEVSYEKIVAVYPGFWSYQRGCLLAAVQATGYTKATVVVSRPGDANGNAKFKIDWG
ncbi:MAG: hypothetical protein ACXVAN_02590 [Polyangia bacterium]